jgi:hypothetical protein
MPCHKYAVLKANSQGHGRVAAGERHGICELVSAVQRLHVSDLPAFSTVGEWQDSGRGTAWERHGMCELALTSLIEQWVLWEGNVLQSDGA